MRICPVEDCEAVLSARTVELCRAHRAAARRALRPAECAVDGCSRPYQSRGYCNMHYQRFRKTGEAGVAESTPGHRHPKVHDLWTCRLCTEEKPADQFYLSARHKHGKRGECKACRRIMKFKRKAEISLSFGEIRDWLATRGETCEICNVAPGTDIDHCHATGALRGLLCRTCNLMLGSARDTPDVLRAGALYLENSKKGISQRD